jgi:hypothetical protein
MEPFIPALLSAATLDKKRLGQIVNLQSDTVVAKEDKQPYFFYEKFITGLICCASALFYLAQKINCQAIQRKMDYEKLLAKRTQLVDLTRRIEAVDERIREQKKVLGDVLVYTEQNRIFCELLNALQGILFRAGDVYLTSFIWNVQSAKDKKSSQNAVPQKNAKDAKGKAAPKKVENKAEKREEQPKALPLSSSISVAGAMFIGDVEITQDIKQHFNDKFNAMFENIRRLSLCADVTDIKVNAPENCKITFRCVIQLDPKSKIMAL